MEIWSYEIKELERLYESLKSQLPEIEKELGQLLKTDDANVALLYSRRCLEVIITDLCECELKRERGTEPLKGIIDKLKKDKKVPSHIISSMLGLNELSTYGTHPKDFDPEQVKPVLINLDIILKWYLKYKAIIIKVKEDERIHLSKGPLKNTLTEASVTKTEKPGRLIRNRALPGVLIISILIIAGIFVYPRFLKNNSIEKIKSSNERITVSIMPFQNKSSNTNWDVWQDGIQDILITSLSNYAELKVRQAESIGNLIQSREYTEYSSITPSVAKAISQKLNSHVFIYGSINQSGKTIRVIAQLIDTNSDQVFKSFQFDGNEDMILPIIDSLAIQLKDFLIISSFKREVTPDEYHLGATTNSPEAFRLFLLGNKEYKKADFFSSYSLYLQAIEIDSNFIGAALKLSVAYYNEYIFDEAKRWCLMAYRKRDQMPLEMKIRTTRVYALLFETPVEEIKYLRQMQELDDLVPTYFYSSGYAYSRLFQFEKAIPEYEKALEIYRKSGLKPSWVFDYSQLGEAYNKTGQYKKEKKLYRKAILDFPDNYVLIYRKCLLAAVEGDIVNEKKYRDKAIQLAKEDSWTDANIAAQIAEGYAEIGRNDNAAEFYREALSLEPENSDRMKDLSLLLIDSGLNLSEGLELIEKALEQNPENLNYLDCKGWGFYKQGKYKEALEILQRSWNLRMEKAVYDHGAFIHLEAAKKAVAGQK